MVSHLWDINCNLRFLACHLERKASIHREAGPLEIWKTEARPWYWFGRQDRWKEGINASLVDQKIVVNWKVHCTWKWVFYLFFMRKDPATHQQLERAARATVKTGIWNITAEQSSKYCECLGRSDGNGMDFWFARSETKWAQFGAVWRGAWPLTRWIY